MRLLRADFYNRSPLAVAPDLLGKILVRKLNGSTISGRIVEVEAYVAFIDEAAHSFIGKTKRNTSLFLPAGHAYVHRIHMQHCLDIVVEKADIPSSVLIRALEPIDGIDMMRKFRGKEGLVDLTSGPGKLSQALRITTELDGIDITEPNSVISIIDDGFIPQEIISGKRVGLSKAQDASYRFLY